MTFNFKPEEGFLVLTEIQPEDLQEKQEEQKPAFYIPPEMNTSTNAHKMFVVVEDNLKTSRSSRRNTIVVVDNYYALPKIGKDQLYIASEKSIVATIKKDEE